MITTTGDDDDDNNNNPMNQAKNPEDDESKEGSSTKKQQMSFFSCWNQFLQGNICLDLAQDFEDDLSEEDSMTVVSDNSDWDKEGFLDRYMAEYQNKFGPPAADASHSTLQSAMKKQGTPKKQMKIRFVRQRDYDDVSVASSIDTRQSIQTIEEAHANMPIVVNTDVVDKAASAAGKSSPRKVGETKPVNGVQREKMEASKPQSGREMIAAALQRGKKAAVKNATTKYSTFLMKARLLRTTQRLSTERTKSSRIFLAELEKKRNHRHPRAPSPQKNKEVVSSSTDSSSSDSGDEMRQDESSRRRRTSRRTRSNSRSSSSRGEGDNEKRRRGSSIGQYQIHDKYEQFDKYSMRPPDSEAYGKVHQSTSKKNSSRRGLDGHTSKYDHRLRTTSKATSRDTEPESSSSSSSSARMRKIPKSPSLEMTSSRKRVSRIGTCRKVGDISSSKSRSRSRSGSNRQSRKTSYKHKKMDFAAIPGIDYSTSMQSRSSAASGLSIRSSSYAVKSTNVLKKYKGGFPLRQTRSGSMIQPIQPGSLMHRSKKSFRRSISSSLSALKGNKQGSSSSSITSPTSSISSSPPPPPTPSQQQQQQQQQGEQDKQKEKQRASPPPAPPSSPRPAEETVTATATSLSQSIGSSDRLKARLEKNDTVLVLM